MYTKKEKLLIRPWITQRFSQHLKKIANAQSVLDVLPPAEQLHVVVKLKKAQREAERQKQIEHENTRLLQKLGSIMNKKRIDNLWSTPRPNFLSREKIDDLVRPRREKSAPAKRTLSKMSESLSTERKPSARRCIACHKAVKEAELNERKKEEGRVPWPAAPKSFNWKYCNQKAESHVCCLYCC